MAKRKSADTGARPDGWRNRIVGSGEEAPDQLLANPKNWRIHPKAQQDALGEVLDRVGWVQNVIVNRQTGFVVDGHARVALAISRGEASVPVVYVDLAPEEEALILATLDPISALATADDALLNSLLEEVDLGDTLADALSYGSGEEIAVSGLSEPDAVPDEPEEPWVKPGNIFALGDHRLMCGDSTDPEDVARLMDGAVAEMVWTDPPYGVGIEIGRAHV